VKQKSWGTVVLQPLQGQLVLVQTPSVEDVGNSRNRHEPQVGFVAAAVGESI
jgi:hypothetical protein